jgi:FixJ family two-component response regulator
MLHERCTDHCDRRRRRLRAPLCPAGRRVRRLQAETFASAREFLAWLPDGRAACLVLDVDVDELSGLDLCDRLTVPIVFITGHDDPATVARIESSGAVGHLRKPFDRKTVLDAIHRAVGARQARVAAGPPALDRYPPRGEGPP